MSRDTREHLVTSTQRRALRIALILTVVLVLALTPVAINGELRLDLARNLGLAPDVGVEQIAETSEATLVVAPIENVQPNGAVEYRFAAVYLARETPDGVVLVDLQQEDLGRTLTLPLASYDRISASPDASHILVVEDASGGESRAVLIERATGTVQEMPADDPIPDLPGEWERSVWDVSADRCGIVSPSARYVACFPDPPFRTYLAGDWQLDVRVYGNYQIDAEIYRGLGFRPFAGWAGAEDEWLYFQNERGIWRVRIQPEMLS